MELKGSCAVCEIPCSTFCSGCHTVFYCSRNHQLHHRKEHKAHCVPVTLIQDEKEGRHFVATKNLVAGQLIFKDEALISGPSGAEFHFHRICLGCYRVVRNSYVCSKCKWPVCNSACESILDHAQFECQLFTDLGIYPFFTAPIEYDFIKYVRTLLLRKLSPAKWASLRGLASHSEARAQSQLEKFKLTTALEFINGICKMEVDIKTIDHVVGIWGINSFGANPPTLDPNTSSRLVTFLFPKMSIVSHNCIPNTRGILRRKMNTDVTEFGMELYASTEIKSGASLYITYADVCQGTQERRQVLSEHYFFSCACLRCEDPTELGTYFSGFKCNGCSIGTIIPINPLDSNGNWKCENKLCSSSTEELNYKQLAIKLENIKRRAESIFQMKNIEAAYSETMNLIKEIKGKTLHPNHWLIIEIQYRIILSIISGPVSKYKKYYLQIEEMCLQCLSVADKIQSGQNSYRGQLIYTVVQTKMFNIRERNKKCSKADRIKNYNKLIELCREGEAILLLEPESSPEWKMGCALTENRRKLENELMSSD